MKYENIIEMKPDLMVFISGSNLPEINDGAYMINLDEYRAIRNH